MTPRECRKASRSHKCLLQSRLHRTCLTPLMSMVSKLKHEVPHLLCAFGWETTMGWVVISSYCLNVCCSQIMSQCVKKCPVHINLNISNYEMDNFLPCSKTYQVEKLLCDISNAKMNWYWMQKTSVLYPNNYSVLVYEKYLWDKTIHFYRWT